VPAFVGHHNAQFAGTQAFDQPRKMGAASRGGGRLQRAPQFF